MQDISFAVAPAMTAINEQNSHAAAKTTSASFDGISFLDRLKQEISRPDQASGTAERADERNTAAPAADEAADREPVRMQKADEPARPVQDAARNDEHEEPVIQVARAPEKAEAQTSIPGTQKMRTVKDLKKLKNQQGEPRVKPVRQSVQEPVTEQQMLQAALMAAADAAKPDERIQNIQKSAAELQKVAAGDADASAEDAETIGTVPAELSELAAVSPEVSDELLASARSLASAAEQTRLQPEHEKADDAVKSAEAGSGMRSNKSVRIGNASIQVTDLRTEQAADQQTAAASARNVSDAGHRRDFVTSVAYNGQGQADITMNLANDVQQNLLSSNTQTAAGAGSNFQAMLTNQLQNNAQEFVRAGSIVLKDNNMGSINLILHPESLGNVKINLQLTDKIIAGHITVASKEAFNAFQESLGSLQEAFTQNGFDTASFDRSWSGQGSGTGYEGQQNQQSRMPFNKYRADAAYGEYAYAESTAPAAATKSDYSVDIVA